MAKAAQPEPEQEAEDKPDTGLDADRLMPAIEKFRQPEYGNFDDFTALALAWNGVSPSDVRERWVKRGASQQAIRDYFLGIDE